MKANHKLEEIMRPPLKLQKELDLHVASDRDALVDAIARQVGTVQHSPADIVSGITVLASLFPGADWLRLSPYMGGSLQVRVGVKATASFPLNNAISLGLQLDHLRQCDGFDRFLQGFNNRTQFFDSVFEAAMADYCLGRSKSLRFSPTYSVKGRAKHPDFELTTKIGKIVCECKSLSESDRKYSKRLSTISGALDSAAKDLGGVPEGYRLEVHIRGPVQGDLNKLAKRLCKTAFHRSADVDKPFEVGPFQFCLVPRNSPVRFPDTGIYHQSIIVGDTPVGLGSEYAYLRITTERIGHSRVKASGDLIHEAKAQLPEAELCVAFVEVISAPSAEQAAHEKLKSNDYRHFWVVGVSSPSGLSFVYRLRDKAKVEGIFGPYVDRQLES